MNNILKLKCVASALALLASLPAFAQPVIPAAMTQLQPQISRDSQGFSACGIRAIVLDTNTEVVDAHDFSLLIRADILMGTLKSGKSRVSKAGMLRGEPGKVVIPAPVKFWIARESEGNGVVPVKTMPANSPGYILEIAELAKTYEAILAIIDGERMQFATRYKNESVENVITFSAKLPPEDLKPLMACLDSVVQQIVAANK
jgi:hypothetical protein